MKVEQIENDKNNPTWTQVGHKILSCNKCMILPTKSYHGCERKAWLGEVWGENPI
jgi:hypothetical protein